MMNEEDVPMPVASNIREVIDTMSEAEAKVNAALGTNFGSTTSGIATAYNGRDPKNVQIVKAAVSDPSPGGIMNQGAYDDYVGVLLECVCSLNGQTARAGKSMRMEYFLNDKPVLRPGDPLISKLNAAGAFLAKHFGV